MKNKVHFYNKEDKAILNEIIEIAENLKFSVDIDNNINESYSICFSKFTDAGQDFSFDIIVKSPLTMNNIHNELYDYYDGYDVSYETYLWLDENGHGTNGAPYELIDVYNDMKQCENFIRELSDATC